ncbi:DUF6279 family lipoprotein [Marinobacter sp. F4218]|uniref:DUF6279 family lipoprotein n=1 Tax=Marinobacter sp. F4218 TaxID=2862868 RepID=UPI001C63408A|nr:DUF6279 family lipoprotein [Marinobacter sp. F4218]MBW7472704.1 DUF3549 domain-containing protein [Marinobacter sp. F4218]
MNSPNSCPPGSIRWIAIICASLMIVSGCSSTRTAYRYADWGIVWWVEDYVTLTDAQAAQLNAGIDQLRQWHCSRELPRYGRWLESLETDVRQRDLDPDTIAYHQEQLFGFFPPLLDKATPIATDLLASLTDAQVRELAENMEDSQREREEEYLSDSMNETASARAERTEERVERWLGDLNGTQKRIVAEWSEQRGRQTEIWLEGRRKWQLALLEALERRNAPGFAADVERLIKDSEEIRGEEYQAMMVDSRAAMKTLMHDLIEAGNSTHLAHLQNRAAELNSDFEALTCSAGSEVASSASD